MSLGESSNSFHVSTLVLKMVFYPPPWAPKLNDNDIPDNVSLEDFVFDDRYRPRKCKESPPPFIESVDGTLYTLRETQQRIEWLAAGLASQLQIKDDVGDVWDRVVSIFAVNSVSSSSVLYQRGR